MREEAISRVYRRTVPRRVAIADLGCSCGPNTFIVISQVITSVEKLCKELNHDSPEYQFFMNDLPGNDFNNIFRIFPTKTLHFVHSSYSLQWLSQGITKEDEMNSFNIPLYTPSPSEVKLEVLKEGSFTINCLEVSENAYEYDDDSDRHKVATKCMRAVVESLLVNHFGEAIIEEVFRQYQQILTDHRKTIIQKNRDEPKAYNTKLTKTQKEWNNHKKENNENT
ncbi:SAM dependent carboxyl methyltransferase [Sesbania bispinosa]|nr:SAM dependent carboxyl methyltransferase [Sesbania bispinosa]